VLYDAFGGVLSSTLTTKLQEALSAQGAIGDADTGLVHLGGGRFYDPALGRPLQPNPAGGPPTVPQALNRYAATAVGAPGVVEGAGGGGISLSSPTAWLGAAGNTALETVGRTMTAKSGYLALRGAAPALEKVLAGRGLPFGITSEYTVGGVFGEFAIGASGRLPLVGSRLQRRLAEKLTVYEIATQGEAGLIGRSGNSQFFFKKFGQTLETEGLEVTGYRPGTLLGKTSKALYASLGLTFLIDTGVEIYGAANGTGRWGNPYWTTGQKTGQATAVVLSDIAVTGGLFLAGAGWWTIPIALGWAFIAEPVVFENIFPGFYEQNRNLQPLNSDGG